MTRHFPNLQSGVVQGKIKVSLAYDPLTQQMNLSSNARLSGFQVVDMLLGAAREINRAQMEQASGIVGAGNNIRFDSVEQDTQAEAETEAKGGSNGEKDSHD